MYHTSAQIAAMADAHFLIEKAVENKSTVSRIRRLTDNDSVAELARMLGGAKITDTVMESAREMKHLPWRKKSDNYQFTARLITSISPVVSRTFPFWG